MSSASTLDHIHQYEEGSSKGKAPLYRQMIETDLLKFMEGSWSEHRWIRKFSYLIIPEFGTTVVEPRAWKSRWCVLGS